MLNDYMIFTGQSVNNMLITIDIPEQTIYELQALAIAKSWDCPISSPEDLDSIMDRLIYSIQDVVITILLWGQSTTYTPETE